MTQKLVEPIDYTRLNQMPMGDVLFSQRSVRRLKPDPIPMEDLHLLFEAAVKAPNGGNAQPARFLLLTDKDVIRDVAKLYKEAWYAKRHDQGRNWNSPDDIPAEDRMSRSAARLAESIQEVPAIVLAFGRSGMRGNAGGNVDGGSVIPAVQNLMLAARALGIGSIPTTLHPTVMERLQKLLGIPDTASFHFLIPLGYPVSERAFGNNRRLPTSQTVYLNRWEGKVPWD
jgi:nitroreductase